MAKKQNPMLSRSLEPQPLGYALSDIPFDGAVLAQKPEPKKPKVPKAKKTLGKATSKKGGLKLTKLESEVSLLQMAVTTGTMLVIDPSSGSQGSAPGYSLWQRGLLVDSGTIAIPHNNLVHQRLYYLSECLRKEFSQPDVLVVEKINVMSQNPGFAARGGSLQRAIGVVISCWPSPLLEVSPSTWHSKLPDYIGEAEYRKTDENDALVMGLVVLQAVAKLQQQPFQVPATIRRKLV